MVILCLWAFSKVPENTAASWGPWVSSCQGWTLSMSGGWFGGVLKPSCCPFSTPHGPLWRGPSPILWLKKRKSREVMWLNPLSSAPQSGPHGEKAGASLHRLLLCPRGPCAGSALGFIQSLCTTPSAGASPSPGGTALRGCPSEVIQEV